MRQRRSSILQNLLRSHLASHNRQTSFHLHNSSHLNQIPPHVKLVIKILYNPSYDTIHLFIFPTLQTKLKSDIWNSSYEFSSSNSGLRFTTLHTSTKFVNHLCESNIRSTAALLLYHFSNIGISHK